MKAKLICRCGHNKKDHQYPAEFAWKDTYCRECGVENSDLNPSMEPICPMFVADNLRMLERLSDKNTRR